MGSVWLYTSGSWIAKISISCTPPSPKRCIMTLFLDFHVLACSIRSWVDFNI